jgi:pyruvate ferredoxin oxidoreductase delta subunit
MIYVKDSNLTKKWDEISPAGTVLQGGSALEVNTGDWRVMIPKFIAEKCNHCMLCFPVCSDYAITVKDGKREDFDFKHCKGCGVCFKVCPLKAITWDKEEK